MRIKKISALTLVAVVAGFSLTACNPNDDAAGAGSPDASSSAPAGQDGSSSGSDDGTTGGGSGSDQAGSGSGSSGEDSMCRTADLDFSVSSGMGEGELVVNMKNTGQATCTMQGYPGVDLKATVGQAGTISAKRKSGEATPKVSLAAGEQTDFLLTYPVNNTGGHGVTFDRLLITPPNETHHATVKAGINIPAAENTGDVEVGTVGNYK